MITRKGLGDKIEEPGRRNRTLFEGTAVGGLFGLQVTPWGVFSNGGHSQLWVMTVTL